MIHPYLTLPIALPGDPDDKDAKDKVVNCDILPAQVLAYHEGFAWGVMLYLSTGQAFMCTLTLDEYRRAVRHYWAELEKLIKNKRTTATLIALPAGMGEKN